MELQPIIETKHIDSFKLGNRIICDGFMGNIRYIGPLNKLSESQGVEEIWIGIEWDDPNRGKHNGTVNGFKYFECRDGCGSLVKPEKINTGVSFLEALKIKYLTGKDAKDEEDLFVVNPHTKEIKKFEMVGMEKIAAKQSNLEYLKEISLSGCGVCCIDSESKEHANTKLENLLKSMIDLDMSSNLLPGLRILESLAKYFPQLEILNLSKNKFIEFDTDGNFTPYPNLKILALNECALNWGHVHGIHKYFPGLIELHICDNSMKSFPLVNQLQPFKNLVTLNLENNSIEDWREIENFGLISSLEKIILSQNKIKEVQYQNPTLFKSLKVLNLSYNQIDNWHSITEINKFPKLEALRFTNNPLLTNSGVGPSLAINLIIASLDKLINLNGSSVRRQERLDAEKYYLRYFASNSSSGLDKERFEQLVGIHGAPDIALSNQNQNQTLSDEIISVNISCAVANSNVTKKIPSSMTIANFKILCQRLFKIETSDQVLFYKENKDAPFPEKMDDDTRSLLYYAVKNNSEILVEHK